MPRLHPAQRLGYLGLLPFLINPLWLSLAPASIPYWLDYLWLSYAALIAGFMAGTLCGRSLAATAAQPQRASGLELWASNLFALAAWVALNLSLALAILVLTLVFAGLLLIDAQSARRLPLPAWYLPLRLQLTTVVIVCLGWRLALSLG